ncbi:PAS domain-containing hybrid sensor histidine kinase/response regulator [Belnapia moabensis]|uniref:PAS domain-containing hybrid sensor histidine kinase/response regulator n=1 Tax=Belnapia moabensis TaxID=365533 RepID=UPI00069334E9|nr:PAS domain-containing protein [Belnapia moabensis]
MHLFEIGPDQVARCDDGLRILFGLAPGARFDHAAWLACLHPDDRDRMQADFARVMLKGGATDIEYRVRRPDGSVRWLLTRAQSAAAPDRPGLVFGVTLDITERRADGDRLRESQRALEESAARLRAALESTTDSVFALSADWRFTFLNDRAVAQLSGGRDLRGQLVWDAFPEAVGGPLWLAYRRCMAERVPTEAEEFYTPLGRLFSTRAFPAEDGGVVVFFRDVTDEGRARRLLAESEARLRLFIERAPAGIAMLDTDMRYIAVSRRFLRDYGLAAEWNPDTVFGQRHHDLFPDLPKRWREVHRRVLAGETLSADDDPFPRADGQTDWVRWEMTPWHRADGAVGGALLFSELVTARVEAERGLARSEARFRAAVRAVSGVVWTNDAKGRMVGDQPGWAALTGQSPEDYQGFGWSSAVHAEDAQPTIEAWERAVARRETFVFEHRVRCGDGVWRRFSVRAVPVLREDGSVREWVGVHTDVSEQREAEAVLARDKAELERLVEERTRDLEETQAQLAHAQRMEALGQLAGGIAHDFNNVLQATLGAAALIERRADNPEVVRRLGRMVAEAAERGTSVTRRLLAFSRRGELRAEPLDPAGLLASMQEILAHSLGAGVEIRVQAAVGLPPLLADKGQLETVLVNLATNARDAMEDGTGTLTLAASAETWAPGRGPGYTTTLGAGAYVRLAVSDTGCGMDATTLARASEPFFTTKEPGKGTGLGLAMARGFAEQSGGGLRIESAPGSGTIVTLWLPVADGVHGRTAWPEQVAGLPGAARPRILLVDDEDLVREVLAQHLSDRGYAVVQASEGATALALLDADEPVDALVSDLSMPRMNGVTLIREAQRRKPRLPAVLLTGFAGEEVELEARGIAEGGFGMMRKPVTGADLAERVAALLEAVRKT